MTFRAAATREAMDLSIFLAVLAAAALHAGWNTLLKGGGDPFLSIAHMTICAAGVSALLLAFVSMPVAAAWPWLIASAAIHMAYRFALIGMYRAGDLGQVYPIARGIAPLLTAMATLALIGERLSPAGNLGIATLACGVALLSLKGGRLGTLEWRAVGLALLTGCFTAAYSLVDGYGARVNGSSPSFAIWMFLVNAVTMLPVQLAMRGREILQTLPTGWRLALGATVISELAYFIAIWAMTKAPIALVAALRETGVLFATLFAVVLLKEPLTRWRVGAALIIVAGMVMLRLA
jgi:drug/metabolite transporter (DMT)-like permease